MLVTSASVLSDVQRGGWAVPLPMLTSENGILEGVLKAGINLDPKSFFKCRNSDRLNKKRITCIVNFANTDYRRKQGNKLQ